MLLCNSTCLIEMIVVVRNFVELLGKVKVHVSEWGCLPGHFLTATKGKAFLVYRYKLNTLVSLVHKLMLCVKLDYLDFRWY